VRIAVATDDRVGIASHFGRCGGFVVFEVDGEKVTEVAFRENRFGHHGIRNVQQEEKSDGHEGHGHHGHERFADALQDCEAVICRGMGERAKVDLAARGICAVMARGDISAQDAALQYAGGTLAISTEAGCQHRHGSCK
jgi:predicted Fe-Mo cluster-binding NifX family protein